MAMAGRIMINRFPVGGPLGFERRLTHCYDQYIHGLKKAVPFYEKYGSIFNWNQPNDGRIHSVEDPAFPGYNRLKVY